MSESTLCVYVSLVLLFIVSSCVSLECETTQLESTSEIDCTATLLSNEDCTSHKLKEQFDVLYEQDSFPGRPSDFILTPIQELYPGYESKGLYPGFDVSIRPPRTADFRHVKGFQMNFHHNQHHDRKCAVLHIGNATLPSNMVSFTLRIYPLSQEERIYNFTTFSLPTPVLFSDKEVETRFGMTTDEWVSGSPTSNWKTTITYFPDTENKKIEFTFVKAPSADMDILFYDITFYIIVANESTDNEERILLQSFRTNITTHTIGIKTPGKYRIGVQPFDDGDNNPFAPTCKCKNGDTCSPCATTITHIIEMPDDGSYPSTVPTVPDNIIPTTTSRTSNTFSSESAEISPIDDGSSHILPSVLGVVAFILVVLIAGLCYKFQRDRIHSWINKDEKRQKQHFHAEPHTNLAFPRNVYEVKDYDEHQQHFTHKRVAILPTDDDVYHVTVVQSFASYLHTHCHCEVEYFPWASNVDKFRWVARTLDTADFHIFVASEAALAQYNAWKNNQLKGSKDLFIPYLSKLLNKLNVHENYTFVRFEYTKNILMPDELCEVQYLLPDEIQELLARIHKFNLYKDNLYSYDLPNSQNVHKSSEGSNFINAIHQAAKQRKQSQSRLDSGYKSHNENSSFDENEWKEVRQKYILNELIDASNQPPRNHAQIQGAFVFDEDSSIAPAITIAEGVREEQEHERRIGAYSNRTETDFTYNENENPYPHHESQIQAKSFIKKLNNQQSCTHETGTTFPQEFPFVPPVSDCEDGDISSQFQMQMIEDINRKFLRSKRPNSCEDDVSGYSV